MARIMSNSRFAFNNKKEPIQLPSRSVNPKAVDSIPIAGNKPTLPAAPVKAPDQVMPLPRPVGDLAAPRPGTGGPKPVPPGMSAEPINSVIRDPSYTGPTGSVPSDTGTRPTGPMVPVRGGGMAPASVATMMKKGGKVKAKAKSSYSSGGKVSSASKRGDGCAQRGKTKGRMV